MLNGDADPGSGDGTEGDFYINTATNWLFGPKNGNGWGAGVSLVGPEGPPGGGSDGWALTGNAATVAGTNYLGTTDNIPFEVRVNNERAGWLSPSSFSTSWGTGALLSTAGSSNTAIGRDALNASSATSDYNSALGAFALGIHNDGSFNTALGYSCLESSTSAWSNTGVGAYSLHLTSTGEQNTGIGNEAMYLNTTGTGNTALGYSALHDGVSGHSNVAVGTNALRRNANRSNLVAVGDSALFNNSLGAQPDNSIEGIYEAHDNVAVGSKALYTNNRGSSNTGIGTGALYANGFGSQNTAVGSGALRNTNNFSGNTGIGSFTLYSNVGGNYNTALGSSAGGNGSPSNFTSLGYVSGYVGGNSNTIEVGNTSVSWIGGQQNWSNYSDGRVKDRVQENVPGLAFIQQLRPVTYHFDLRKENELVYGDKEIGEWEGKYDLEKRQMTGFIAQEVETAAKTCGYDFSGVSAPAGTAKLYSLSYSEFVVPLVKAVQEQQALIEKLTRRIEELERR